MKKPINNLDGAGLEQSRVHAAAWLWMLKEARRENRVAMLKVLIVIAAVSLIIGMLLRQYGIPLLEKKANQNASQRSDCTDYGATEGSAVLVTSKTAEPFMTGQDKLRTVGREFCLPFGKFHFIHFADGFVINFFKFGNISGFFDVGQEI